MSRGRTEIRQQPGQLGGGYVTRAAHGGVSCTDGWVVLYWRFARQGGETCRFAGAGGRDETRHLQRTAGWASGRAMGDAAGYIRWSGGGGDGLAGFEAGVGGNVMLCWSTVLTGVRV